MNAAVTIQSHFRAPRKGWGRGSRKVKVVPPVNFASAAKRIKVTRRFTADDIELLRSTFVRFDFALGRPSHDFVDSFLGLPEWFRFNLAVNSSGCAAEQLRLWRIVAGVEGDCDRWVHEKRML